MPNISTATAAPAPAAVDRRRGPRPAAAAPPALRDAPGGAPAATPGSSRLRQHPVRGGRQCASTEQHTPGPFRPEHTHGEDHPHARNRYSRRRTRYRTAPRGLTSCSARRWQENAHGGQSSRPNESAPHSSPPSPGQTLKLAAAAEAARQLSRAGHCSPSPPPQHAPAPRTAAQLLVVNTGSLGGRTPQGAGSRSWIQREHCRLIRRQNASTELRSVLSKYWRQPNDAR